MELFESLGRDHRSITAVVGAFERYLDELGSGRGSHQETWRFLYFFREFAERYHQRKEEEILFTALSVHGYAEDVGPVAHLRSHHARERAALEELHQLQLDPGGAGGETWLERGRSYAAFMREHMSLENQLLFPAAARELFFDPRKPLKERLAEHDQAELSDGRGSFFERLALELAAAH